jgi:release factor glutamine methyltransferase
MKLREWLDRGEAILNDGPHSDRARRDAELLLLHHIGKNKAWLIAHDNEEFAGCSAIGYSGLLERRRQGEPMQYITGECEFYGLPFRVTPDVLIPRPETEHLVETVLRIASAARNLGAPGLDSETWESAKPNRPPHIFDIGTQPIEGAPSKPPHSRFGWEITDLTEPPRILDVGTGSGAIAISLAMQIPNAAITAVDISEPALSIARENAARNQVADHIRFLHGDLLASVAGERFEIIVSNPPYVPNTDRALIAVEVREHEPHIALFGGHDGLEIYRRLIPAAYATLIPGGFLAFEFGFSQQPDIESLLTSAGFHNIQFIHDLQGIPRVASAQRS